MADRYDVFVGNLGYGTTEEHLREKFSFVGPVKGVRLLLDKDTGKMKGFAFVEYYDANTALSAIRHLDQVELLGRKLKVGYPAQSNLKEIARQIGQVAPDSSIDGQSDRPGQFGEAAAVQQFSGPAGMVMRRDIERSVVCDGISLAEAWDVLDAMKRLIASDNNKGLKAKAILENHPQLVSAVYEIQRRLGLPLPMHIQEQNDELDRVQEELRANQGPDTPGDTTDVNFPPNQPPFPGQPGMLPPFPPPSAPQRYTQPPTLPPQQNGYFQHRRYVPPQQQNPGEIGMMMDGGMMGDNTGMMNAGDTGRRTRFSRPDTEQPQYGDMDSYQPPEKRTRFMDHQQ